GDSGLAPRRKGRRRRKVRHRLPGESRIIDVVEGMRGRVIGEQAIEPVGRIARRFSRSFAHERPPRGAGPQAARAVLSFCLARRTWVLTVPTGMPNTNAASSCDRSLW